MTPTELLAAVRCPPAPPNYTPREQASPTALQLRAACPRAWGERYLNGRREPSLTWAEAEGIPEPAKPARGCSAIERATYEQARKARNKLRRPALGVEVHAILSAYMTQNTPGAWHPPMVWREVEWSSEAGKIARPAVDVLPDPRGLVDVYTELAAEVKAPAGWVGEWPHMPGFYDLITVERVRGCERPLLPWCRYRLWDFKTTSSFDWAKTPDELAEDPQVLLYALHAMMQTFGLPEIECNWVYLLTEGRPRAYVVTVTITLKAATAAVEEMAREALAAVESVRLFRAGHLRVVDLERNVSACTAYGGCIYHVDKGGPCDAQVSPGKALKQKSELEAKIAARKSARKENEMSISFQQRKAQRDAEAAKAKGGATDGAGPTGTSAADVESHMAWLRDWAGPTGTSEAPAGAGGTDSAEPPTDGGGSAESAAAATAKLRANRAAAKPAKPATDGGITVDVEGHTFAVPAGSALGKALAKASKAAQALEAAFAGE